MGENDAGITDKMHMLITSITTELAIGN